ncbi:hypothetical protein FRC06_000674 [Ceratobasidium sp. 370]|nr:hypothetical protein FRC06_000674 [Ceratobasidium sp. 370]
MDNMLAAFHNTKHALIDLGIYQGCDVFNHIAKLHMVGHYQHDIHELGTPDRYSTKMPEYLHIIYIKIPWWFMGFTNPPLSYQ